MTAPQAISFLAPRDQAQGNPIRVSLNTATDIGWSNVLAPKKAGTEAVVVAKHI